MKKCFSGLVLFAVVFILGCEANYKGKWEIESSTDPVLNIGLSLLDDKSKQITVDGLNKVYFNGVWVNNILDTALELIIQGAKSGVDDDSSLSFEEKKRNKSILGSAKKEFYFKGDCLYAGVLMNDKRTQGDYCVAKIVSDIDSRIELGIETESKTYYVTLKKM